jgi:hypothetical protein
MVPNQLYFGPREGTETMAYQPIENYGIIGNMRTVAHVGMNGSIDWYCYPHLLDRRLRIQARTPEGALRSRLYDQW